MTSISADCEATLKRLVNECSLAIRLEQHYRISGLCLQIGKQLVQLFDLECENRNAESGDDDDSNDGLDSERSRDDDEDELMIRRSFEWRFIGKINTRLRHLSSLAEIYGDVLEFVRVRDLVCLAKLVGANKRHQVNNENNSNNHDEPIDIETLSRILRQCTILLKELNGLDHLDGVDIVASHEQHRTGEINNINNNQETMTTKRRNLSLARITRSSTNTGFPRHIIELVAANEHPQTKTTTDRTNEDTMAENGLYSSSSDTSSPRSSSSFQTVNRVIQSNWFQDYLVATQKAAHEMIDRFTILVALWIVADKCQHRTAELLMGELIDQLHHQEANSCQLDELMQLTQVGSFWLSYKKRYLVTMKRPQAGQVLSKYDDEDDDDDDDDDDEDDDDYDDDEDDDGDNDHGSNDNEHWPDDRGVRRDSRKTLEQYGQQGDNLTSSLLLQPPIQNIKLHNKQDFRAQLRCTVDDELLFGRRCPLCDRQPSGDLLEPIKLTSCPKCGLELWPLVRAGWSSSSSPAGPTGLFCCLSYQPINWFPLGSLLAACERIWPQSRNWTQDPLIVLTPNEYSQQVLQAAKSVDERLAEAFAGNLSRDNNKLQASVGCHRNQHNQHTTSGGGGQLMGERIDISDKFERLTVLRSERVEAADEIVSNENDGDDEDDDDDDDEIRDDVGLDDEDFEDFSQDGATDQLGEAGLNGVIHAQSSTATDASLASLSAFLTVRFKLLRLKRQPPAWLQLSETLQLVQYLFSRHDSKRPEAINRASRQHHQTTPNDSTSIQQLVIYSGDLLVFDCELAANGPMLASLYLVAKKHSAVPPSRRLTSMRQQVSQQQTNMNDNEEEAEDKYSHSSNTNNFPSTTDRGTSRRAAASSSKASYLTDGICSLQPIYACRARSPTSKLQLGCGRLFSPLELARICRRRRDQSMRLMKYVHHELIVTSSGTNSGSEGNQPKEGENDAAADESSCPACRSRLVLLQPGGDLMQRPATTSE